MTATCWIQPPVGCLCSTATEFVRYCSNKATGRSKLLMVPKVSGRGQTNVCRVNPTLGPTCFTLIISNSGHCLSSEKVAKVMKVAKVITYLALFPLILLVAPGRRRAIEGSKASPTSLSLRRLRSRATPSALRGLTRYDAASVG